MALGSTAADTPSVCLLPFALARLGTAPTAPAGTRSKREREEMKSYRAPASRRAALVGVLVIGVAAASGCSGTPSVGKAAAIKNDAPASCSKNGVIDPSPSCVAKLGQITLNVADMEGAQPAQTLLNSAFEKRYPNIKIKRTNLDYDQWVVNGKVVFALANHQAPDVMEADSADATYGKLIKAGLLIPLDKYYQAWGWNKLDSSATVPQRLNRDLSHVGTGTLYGLSPTLQLTGYFYNKKLMAKIGGSPPNTMSDFFSLLTKAKADGLTPIQGGDRGDRDVSTLQGGMAEAATLPSGVWRKLSYADLTSSAVLDKGGLQAAELIKRLASYMAPGFLGYDTPNATARFTHGNGLLFPMGNWAAPDLVKQMGNNVGFFLMPAERPGPRASWFGQANPWMIPDESKHPSAAAVYLDFLTSPQAAVIYAKNNDIPALPLPPSQFPKVSPLNAETLSAGRYLTQNDSGRPWPVTLALSGSALAHGYTHESTIQELMANRLSPQAWLAAWKKGVSEDIAAAHPNAS
jgi:raffinose/stachyose/melibiose transport system substrate-binding protein